MTEQDTDVTDDSRTSVVGRKRDLQDREPLTMMNSEHDLDSPGMPAILASGTTKGDGKTVDAALISPVEVPIRADGDESHLSPTSTVVQETEEKGPGANTTMAGGAFSAQHEGSSVPSQTQPALYLFPTDQGHVGAGVQARNTVPVFAQDGSQLSPPKDDPTPPSSGWNKGVQPGLRTSFGAKRSSRTANPPKQPPVSQPKGPVIGETKKSEIASNSPKPQTQKPMVSQDSQASKVVSDNPPPVGVGITTAEALQISQEPPESIRAGTRSSNIEAVTADVDLVLAQTKSWPLPAAWRAAVLINTGKTFYPTPARITRPFQHHSKIFATPLMFNELGMPYKIQDFSFNTFAPAFLKANLGGIHDWKIGDLRSAFHCYQSNWYCHLPDLQPILLASSRATGFLTFEQAMDLASEGRKPVENATQPSVQPQQVLPALKSSRRSSKQTEKYQPLVSSTSVTIDLTGWSPKHGNNGTDVISKDNDVQTTNSLPLSKPKVAVISKDNDVQMTNSLPLSKPKVAAIVISPEEVALQKRYFPSDGESIYRCLACGDTGHGVGTCPALYCEHCMQVGKHSSFMCPSHHRCLKCRQRGFHGAVNCPEKLFARAESSPCDICGSLDHLEEACQFVWRSFAPKQEEIKVVRDIPIHCYQCGADGHYGPSCGLSRDCPGGLTWTLTNLRKYVDIQSLDRAVSAGVDYSMPKPKQKEFSIKGKGKSNDPFTIDDSDDESDFIRPKINKAPAQNGHIHFNEPPRNAPRSFNDNLYRPQYREEYQEDYRDSGRGFNVQNHIQDSYSRATYQQHPAPNYPPLDQQLAPREERYSMRKRPRADSPGPGPGPAPEAHKKQKKKKSKALQQAKAQHLPGGSAPTDPKIQRKLGKNAKKREREAKAAAAARNASGQY